jgi:hypothetical protein
LYFRGPCEGLYTRIGPWSRPSRMQPRELTRRGQIGHVVILFLFLVSLVGGALLARYNVLAKRSDRRGAMRVAAFVFGLEMLLWCWGASHVPTPVGDGPAHPGYRPSGIHGGPNMGPLSRTRAFREAAMATNAHFLDSGAGRTHPRPAGRHTCSYRDRLGHRHSVTTSGRARIGTKGSGSAPRSAFRRLPFCSVAVISFVLYLNDAISRAMIALFLMFVLRVVVRRDRVAAFLCAAIYSCIDFMDTSRGCGDRQ